MTLEDVVDPDGPPPWLHLLTPLQKAWREKEILFGRDPDPYILKELKSAGRWPVREGKVKKREAARR